MKTFVFGILGLLITCFVGITVLMLSTLDTRKNNLENDLALSLETAMKEAYSYAGTAEGFSEEEFQAALVENIISQTGDQPDRLQIHLLALDLEKGLVSVEVVKQVQTVWRQTQISCLKTLILDRSADTEEQWVQIRFLVEHMEYAAFELPEHDAVILPPEPHRAGVVFQGWRLAGSEICYSAENPRFADVTESMDFEAIFVQEGENV